MLEEVTKKLWILPDETTSGILSLYTPLRNLRDKPYRAHRTVSRCRKVNEDAYYLVL